MKYFSTLRHPLPAVVAALLILLLPALAPRPAAAAPPAEGPPPRVVVERIAVRDVSPANEYVGHVEAIQAVDLRARVEGFLEQVCFEEGDYVRAGQVLYVIEQAPYRARLAAARAQMAEARAEVVRAGQHLERLRAARPESIPATDMDNAEAAVYMAEARLAEAEARRDLAELDYSYTTITAPIAGRLGRTAYTLGNLVGPDSGPLARIVQVDPIRVVYAVSENDLDVVMTALEDAARGLSSRLLAPELRLAGGRLVAAGRVSFVDNCIDPDTGTIAVRAEFANGDGRLIPGQYVTAVVRSSTPRVLPLVPQAAVIIDKAGSKVMVVDENNIVTPRPVILGPAQGYFWVVESGLAAGDLVIVQGLQKVRPGIRVEPEIRESLVGGTRAGENRAGGEGRVSGQ